MEIFLEVLQNYGFPVACVVVLFVQNNKFSNTLSELSQSLGLMNERLKDIEENTKK